MLNLAHLMVKTSTWVSSSSRLTQDLDGTSATTTASSLTDGAALKELLVSLDHGPHKSQRRVNHLKEGSVAVHNSKMTVTVTVTFQKVGRIHTNWADKCA
ncbi:hypothetical protein SDJN03_19889, partial [Cucurbita argyrosperma subsp. sororia]